MEKRHDEMGIPRYKQKSMVGDYSSVELTKTIIHASPFKVHCSFCMGPVTRRHLCCSLGLLGNIQNNVKCSAVLLSLKCFAYFFLEKCLHTPSAGCRQDPAWILGKHLPQLHVVLSPLAGLLQLCL